MLIPYLKKMDLIIFGGLVLGLTEIVKRTLGLQSKYIPLSALVITAILATTYTLASNLPFTWELVQNTLVVALTSVGLFSSVKNTTK